MKVALKWIVMIAYLTLFAIIYFSLMSSAQARCTGVISEVVVEKSKKTMTIYDTANCDLFTYTVRTGLNSGPKHCEGDKKTPEGTYYIKAKRSSKYIWFLELDYPNAQDIAKAKELGCNPGSAVGIHYYNKEYTNDPSTLEGSLGCVTVWDKKEINDINDVLPVGTKVIIKP